MAAVSDPLEQLCACNKSRLTLRVYSSITISTDMHSTGLFLVGLLAYATVSPVQTPEDSTSVHATEDAAGMYLQTDAIASDILDVRHLG
jgi:hypothetical protein